MRFICNIEGDIALLVSLLTTACRYFSDISHYEFGKMFVTHITLSHAFKKIIQMSKWWVNVSAQNLLALWTLGPWARAALFEYMLFVRVLESKTFCSLFANPFHDFSHNSNQQQPPLPLFIGDMRSSAKQSLAVGVSGLYCLRLSLSLWQF